MRFAEDRRARVPFALVGVLLLVGSAGLSATLAGGPTPATDQSVGVALNRTTAATSTALRAAVARAGREAARAPVTAVGNASGVSSATTAGVAATRAAAVVNASSPFRDYLRVRILVAARAALDGVGVRVGGVRGSASLPATPNASALRAAKRRVELAPAGDPANAGLRVTVENVTVAATRDGRTVARKTVSPTLTVATPALALHRRVTRYESRLNRGPLAPGLGRRLTARLYAVAWARGYAQYGGAPIENVVANRHVALATNGALLREQRVAFGRSDPAGRSALRWATARVGATDLLAGADVHYGTEWSRGLLAAAEEYRRENPMPGGVAGVAGKDSRDERASPDRSLRVAVNRTADRAFADLVTGANGTGLDALLRSSYAVDARVVAAVRRTAAEPRPSPDPPAANWTLIGTTVRTATEVRDATGPPPGTPAGWHLLGTDAREVVRTHSLVATWEREGSDGEHGTGHDPPRRDPRETVQRWTETYRVRVGVAGDHGATGPVADAEPTPRPTLAGVHERGGALAGPNLRDVARRATDRLVADRGGYDALARRAVAGTLDTRPREVVGRQPANLREWVYRDLARLRERVRDVSVAVDASATLGEGSAAGALAEAVRARRPALVGAPERYDGVADRARVAARAAYVDRVLARLDARADRAASVRDGLGDALAAVGSSLDRARRVLRERTSPGTPRPRPMPADGPGRATDLAVSGAPPYLTLAALDPERVGAIPAGEQRHPLAARNVNVFAAPYGDAADAVMAALSGDDGGDDRTGLRTAALALRAANRTLAERDGSTAGERGNRTLVEREGSGNRTLARERDRLRASLEASLARVRQRLVARLDGPRLDLAERERRAAVRSGLGAWNAIHARALAVANGSAERAIVDAIVRENPALRPTDRRDWVAVRVDLALVAARQAVAGPPESTVERTATAFEGVARRVLDDVVTDALRNATEAAGRRWVGDALGAIPAGLPVAPVPGYWYATVNAWTVDVRGRYARFAVTAPGGPPGASTTYVREARTVRLDWDGDGEREVVGRTEPVAFETGTVVAVIVPPGSPGVGDRGGTREEASAGWSD